MLPGAAENIGERPSTMQAFIFFLVVTDYGYGPEYSETIVILRPLFPISVTSKVC